MTACAAFLLAAAVGIGGELQLLWDDEIVDTARTTAARVTHRPENAGVVMTMDRPWENFVQYFNVFRDGDRYRLYYTGYADRAPEPNPHGIRAPYIYIACLESKDGIAWTRPELGLREFDGSKANNIILDKTDVRELDNCFVFWYMSKKDMRHVAFSCAGKFDSQVRSPTVCFRSSEASNTLLEVGAPDGKGFLRDVDCNLDRVNDPARTHEKYLR